MGSTILASGGAGLIQPELGLSLWALVGLTAAIVICSGIVGASLLNAFIFKSGTADLAISIVGVVVFVGLTAWNVQKISRGDYAAATGSMEKGAVIAALALYLDFINLFFLMLRILGGSRRS